MSASGGTLQISDGSSLPDTVTVTLANSVGSGFDIDDSSETILAVTGGGGTGGSVGLGSGTLTVGGADNSSAFAGAISGTGGLTKDGHRHSVPFRHQYLHWRHNYQRRHTVHQRWKCPLRFHRC